MDFERIAARIVASQQLLATNYSGYSYEYDVYHVEAQVYVDMATARLRLDMVETHKKTGLGAGTRKTTQEYNLGTLAKPKLGQVRSILKKHGMTRSRFGTPFRSKWNKPEGGEDSLGNILRDAKAAMTGLDPEQMREEIFEKIRRMNPRQLEKLLAVV